jgi:hypothetical protein
MTAHINRSGRYSWHDGRLSVESITAWRRRRAADRALLDAHTMCLACHTLGGHTADCHPTPDRATPPPPVPATAWLRRKAATS